MLEPRTNLNLQALLELLKYLGEDLPKPLFDSEDLEAALGNEYGVEAGEKSEDETADAETTGWCQEEEDETPNVVGELNTKDRLLVLDIYHEFVSPALEELKKELEAKKEQGVYGREAFEIKKLEGEIRALEVVIKFRARGG